MTPSELPGPARPRSFSVYLARISVSRLTVSPSLRVSRVVSDPVWGMMETLKSRSVTAATVRLMPSMVMDPFSTIYFRMPGSASIRTQTAFSSRVMERMVPVPSM